MTAIFFYSVMSISKAIGLKIAEAIIKNEDLNEFRFICY